MTQANNIAVTLGWLAGSYKIANAEEMIVKSLKAQVQGLPKDGILDLWYDMTNRKAKLNAGDWCSSSEIDAWKAALIKHEAVDTEADIDLMDEAGGPGTGDWVKIASAVGTDIRDSAISGKGLFATRSFSTGDVLVTDFMQKQNTDDPRTRWEQSDSCRYTNHSDKPNAFIRKLGETVELVADETIQPNEEITCNYRDASKTLGKAFFYTYRGKPYGNGPSESSFMQKTAATLPDTFYGLPTFLKQSQTTDDILDRIANARAQTATEVSDGNAAAGNYRKGRFNYHGLRISIENPKGSIRSGVSASGTKWSNEMKSDYGYIRGTIGADGDPVDVFIGDDPKSELVFIVNQVNKNGSFDEHKVVLGVMDAKQARQTYLANYKPGWTGAGSVIGMTMPQFKSWLRGDVTKPAESIKQAADLGIPELPQPKRTRVVMPYDDGYLLERMNNPKYPANLGRQRFPGGGIDAGETSQQAAAREMMEELGLSVKPEQLRSLGIHANADHGPEEYFELADHGIQPGNYTASIGGDKHIELIKGLLNSPHYWGAQLNTLQQPNPTTGMKQASGQELAAARLRALLIEGNPERPGDPERMHVSLQRLLDSLGYDVQRVSSADYTDVPDSDLAVGFSRGADRLRFSNAPLRIGIGSGRSMDGVQMVNHPRDRVNLANPDDFNTLPVATQRAHSTLTKGMKNKLTGLIAGGANTAVSTVKQAENHTAVAPCDNPVQVLINMADTTAWRQVPKQVAKLMKSASDIKKQVQKAMETLSVADPGYGYVYWHPKRNSLWAVLSDSDEQDAHDAWWKALSKIPGINKVITESEVGPHGDHKDEWIQIKKARIFTKNSTINPFTLAGKPFGGPNAVTNSVVGALIGGGLGYGGGRLAEMLLPERHFERGRLSKNLALAGAVLGTTPGLVQGATHMGMNSDAGDPSAYRSWLQPTNAQKVAPNSAAWRKHVLGKMAGADPTPTHAAILRRSAKCAMTTMSGFGNAEMRPINVDAFNNVIWHDPYSPPAVNAAAAGIVSGIQQHYGGASVLTPRHFIKGLAAAGVDAATATVAGGVLGVLGGLKPDAQQTLQQMGLWSGLMRGSIGSIFGQ